jgi:hypothetical protein
VGRVIREWELDIEIIERLVLIRLWLNKGTIGKR